MDIYIDVLETIGNGIDLPVRITYETNLSWEEGCNVFDALLGNEFIHEEKIKNSVRFYLTKKGRNVLSYYLKALEERERLIQSNESFS